MAEINQFTFTSCNGKTAINAREWLPESEPRAIIQIAHGVAEHILRYNEFAGFLAKHGFIVVANDHLGHGLSAAGAEELGYFGESSGWEMVVGDMRRLFEITSEKHPGLPYFLFGHSMGSFLSRTYIIRYRTGLSGVILSGTGQQPRAMVEAGRLLAGAEIKLHGAAYKSRRLNDIAFGGYNRAFAPVRTLSDWISRDEAQVDKYVDDPLCGYIPSAGLFRDMFGGIDYVSRQRNLSRMKKDLPVYFISGDHDPVGEFGKGVLRAYTGFLKAGMTDVSLKLYHEGRHELLNELNRDEVYADILTWLESKLDSK